MPGAERREEATCLDARRAGLDPGGQRNESNEHFRNRGGTPLEASVLVIFAAKAALR